MMLQKSTSQYIIVVVEYNLMIEVTMAKNLIAMVVTLVNMMTLKGKVVN